MIPFARRRALAAALLLLVLTPALARSQQEPDAEFEAAVVRPAFTNQHPVVLFDAAHNNLYTGSDRLNQLVALAQNDGCEIKGTVHAFTPEMLGGVHMLVIADPVGDKNPMSAAAEHAAFTRAECEAVTQWVKAGGGLLFIAEHAPTGIAARGLALMLGVDMTAGYLSDAALQDSTIGGSTLVFTRAGGNIGDHPITRGRDSTERIQRVRTFTGQSLAGPEGSATLLKLSDLAADNMIRAGRPPGPIPDSLVHSAKGRAQAVAFPLGKGRVVVLADAAMLSAHLMKHGDKVLYRIGMSVQDADNRQFALNVMRWLGGALN